MSLLPWMAISMTGKTLVHEWGARAVLVRAAAIILLEMLWVFLIEGAVAGRTLGIWDVLLGVGVGVLMVTLQVVMARGAVRMSNHAREWRMLDIAG